MTTTSKKHQLLESIQALDSTQAEKVLAYIQGLNQASREDASYQKLKREAMKEIRQALGGRKLNLLF